MIYTPLIFLKKGKRMKNYRINVRINNNDKKRLEELIKILEQKNISQTIRLLINTTYLNIFINKRGKIK